MNVDSKRGSLLQDNKKLLQSVIFHLLLCRVAGGAGLLSHEMRNILFVFVANILIELRIGRSQFNGHPVGPGLWVGFRIINSKCNFHVPEIQAAIAFDHVQGTIVKAARIDDQGSAFPATLGIAEARASRSARALSAS